MADNEKHSKSREIKVPGLLSRLSPVHQPSGQGSSGEVTVSIDLLDPNPKQHRRKMDEKKLAELMAGIRSLDQVLLPVICCPSKVAEGRLTLIAGHRRTEALKRIRAAATTDTEKTKWSAIPAKILLNATDEDLHKIALQENLNREDPSHLDIALGFLEYKKDFKLDTKTAAERLGKELRTMQRYLRLAEAPEVIHRAVDTGISFERKAVDGSTETVRRTMDLIPALDFLRYWEHLQKKSNFNLEKDSVRLRTHMERALGEQWGARRIADEVDALIEGRKTKTEESSPAKADAPFTVKKSDKKLVVTVDVEQLLSSTPEQLAQVATQLQELVAASQLQELVTMARSKAPKSGAAVPSKMA